MTDFDRFKLMVAKKKRAKEVKRGRTTGPPKRTPGSKTPVCDLTKTRAQAVSAWRPISRLRRHT